MNQRDGKVITEALKAHADTLEALKACYDILRELTDSDIVDLDELRSWNSEAGALANDITKALTQAADIVAVTYGTDAVK
jgi:hypothetical protein